MNSERESIRLTIRSRRVPVRTEVLRIPYPTPLGQIIRVQRVVLYDYVLDREQERVLGEARRFAGSVGARLLVSDLSREVWRDGW